MTGTSAALEDRILVLAPTGRDAKLACEVLSQAGFEARACETVEALCAEIEHGVGAILIAEEALTPHAQGCLAAALKGQPAWSDLPVVVLAGKANRHGAALRVQQLLGVLGNVTFIERPMQVPTLVTAVRSALRARTRQYAARATLQALERQEVEARQRADFEQQLIGIVSHDLRNPLHAILLSTASMVNRPGLDERMGKNLQRIRTSADRAVRLIRDLLDFTQARLGGGIRVEPTDTDLNEVVRAVADELEQAHPEGRIALSTAADGKGRWDPDRVAQIVSNLLSNALTYGAPGSIIEARTHSDTESVTFEVHNQGDPIPEEVRARLFQPLERGHVRGDTSSRSIGLGLFIVQHVVHAHGGTVSVESRAGAGTRFTVRLPRITPVAKH